MLVETIPVGRRLFRQGQEERGCADPVPIKACFPTQEALFLGWSFQVNSSWDKGARNLCSPVGLTTEGVQSLREAIFSSWGNPKEATVAMSTQHYSWDLKEPRQHVSAPHMLCIWLCPPQISTWRSQFLVPQNIIHLGIESMQMWIRISYSRIEIRWSLNSRYFASLLK